MNSKQLSEFLDNHGFNVTLINEDEVELETWTQSGSRICRLCREL